MEMWARMHQVVKYGSSTTSYFWKCLPSRKASIVIKHGRAERLAHFLTPKDLNTLWGRHHLTKADAAAPCDQNPRTGKSFETLSPNTRETSGMQGTGRLLSNEGEILPHLGQLRKALSKFQSIGIGWCSRRSWARASLLILIQAKITQLQLREWGTLPPHHVLVAFIWSWRCSTCRAP